MELRSRIGSVQTPSMALQNEFRMLLESAFRGSTPAFFNGQAANSLLRGNGNHLTTAFLKHLTAVDRPAKQKTPTSIRVTLKFRKRRILARKEQKKAKQQQRSQQMRIRIAVGIMQQKKKYDSYAYK